MLQNAVLKSGINSYTFLRQQCFTTKHEYQVWQNAQNDFRWYNAFNNLHFANNPTLTISRQDIFNIPNHSIRELILKTIYWGYPRGPRGNHFNNILNNIKTLERALTAIKNKANPRTADFTHLAGIFQGIPGLGISTYSKLLYFLNIEFDGFPCLILDNRLIDIFSSNVFEDYNGLSQIRYHNAANHYINYLNITNQIAERLETKGENIEQFLFLFENHLQPSA